MEDPISSSNSDTNQPHLSHGYPSPFRGNYEEPEPTLSYPYPSSPFRWSFFDAPISSLHDREYLGFTCVPQIEDEAYEEGQFQSSDCENWLSSCWQDDSLLSHENATWDYGPGNVNSYKSEEHGETDQTYYGNVENQSGCDHDDPWSWVRGGGDECCYGYRRPEPRYSNSYEEMGIAGLCEGIFGYWPCLLREYQKTYGQ